MILSIATRPASASLVGVDTNYLRDRCKHVRGHGVVYDDGDIDDDDDHQHDEKDEDGDGGDGDGDGGGVDDGVDKLMIFDMLMLILQ